MAILTFYGGVREVGGNKVLLEDDGKALFFDFGFPFKRYKDFYEEYLKPRAGAGLLDPMILGLLPPLRGIYRKDLEPPKLWELFKSHPCFRELEGLDGVLLSHAHLDHSGYISFLKKEIPVYATAKTAFIAKAIQDSSKAEFDQRVCYFTPLERGRPEGWKQEGFLSDQHRAKEQRLFRLSDLMPEKLSKEALEFWTRGFWGRSPRQKELIPYPLGMYKDSSFHLKCFPIDHSIPGACAWGVETSSGWIVYTGDLRFHGKQGKLTERFVKEAAKLKPKALLIEGTRAGEEERISEEEVEGNLRRVVERAKGKLIIADFGPRNVERLLTFLEIAKEPKVMRRLVITVKDAYLLRTIHLLDPESLDVANDDYTCLYQKTTGDKYPDTWQRNIYQDYASKIVLAEEVRRNPQDYILCFSFSDINELASLQPYGGVYIYSASEPHDEEEGIDLERLHKWLKYFHIEGIGLPRKVAPEKWEIPEGEQAFHASGHASGPELLELVKNIAPKVLIPIHTEKPEYFYDNLKGTGIEVHLPEYGQEEGINGSNL